MTTKDPSPSTEATSRDTKVRVMTFNVRGSFHPDGANAWPKRRELNLKTIEMCDPDIIAFQEVQTGNFEAYNNPDSPIGKNYGHVVGFNCKRPMHWSIAELSERWQASGTVVAGLWSAYDYVATNYGSSSQHDEYLPIYWRQNRFELLQNGAFYLSETAQVESIGWESKLLRAATWVKLKEKRSGSEFVVVNTHFPHESHDQTRTECARVILQQLRIINQELTPVIVMGDFNCDASFQNEAYASFLANGYQDTYKTTDESIINTFHHFLGSQCPWNLGRIDWILTYNSESIPLSTRIEPARPAEVILDASPPLYPSDHYPIVADLALRRSLA